MRKKRTRAESEAYSHRANGLEAHFTLKGTQFPISRVLSFKRRPSDFGILSSENTPTEIPRGSKKRLKKGHKYHPPKKGTNTAFCAGPLTPKKKVGVEQEEVAQVILDSA